MRPRDIYKAYNYGVIDLNKEEDIITCRLGYYYAPWLNLSEEGESKKTRGRRGISDICSITLLHRDSACNKC